MATESLCCRYWSFSDGGNFPTEEIHWKDRFWISQKPSYQNTFHIYIYTYICSYLGNGTLTSASQFSLLVHLHISADWFLTLISKTLKLRAVAEGVWHDNIFIEVIWMSIAITLDLINDLMNRDDWCLVSISMGQFWWGLVSGSIVWMIHFCWRNALRRHYRCGYSF